EVRRRTARGQYSINDLNVAVANKLLVVCRLENMHVTIAYVCRRNNKSCPCIGERCILKHRNQSLSQRFARVARGNGAAECPPLRPEDTRPPFAIKLCNL